MTHLRQIMLEELQCRNYSEATIGYYVRKVEAFVSRTQLHHKACALQRPTVAPAERLVQLGYCIR